MHDIINSGILSLMVHRLMVNLRYCLIINIHIGIVFDGVLVILDIDLDMNNGIVFDGAPVNG